MTQTKPNKYDMSRLGVPIPGCLSCKDRGWVVRDQKGNQFCPDGTWIAHKCDQCNRMKDDEDAAMAARNAGLSVSRTYPFWITDDKDNLALFAKWGHPNGTLDWQKSLDPLAHNAINPLRIKRSITLGEMDPLEGVAPFNVQTLYDAAGELLDRANAHEILGEVLFEGADGEWYTMTTEAVLGKASPEFVKLVLEKHVEDEPAAPPVDNLAELMGYYKCPNCGETELQQLTEGVTNSAAVIRIRADGLVETGDEHNEGGGESRYVCGGCEELVAENCEELVRWLRTRKQNTKA